MTAPPVTFYRRPSGPGRATPVVVAPDRRSSGIDIRIRRLPVYCVRGEVRDSKGYLLGHVAISVEQGPWSTGVISEGGRFLLVDLPEGPYTITVCDRPQLGNVLWRRLIHVRGPRVNKLAIVLPPPS